MQLVTLFNITQERKLWREKKKWTKEHIQYTLSWMHAVGWVMNALHMRNRVLACLKCMENCLYSLKKLCVLTPLAKISTLKKCRQWIKLYEKIKIENKKKLEKCDKGMTDLFELFDVLKEIRFKVWKLEKCLIIIFERRVNVNETKNWILILEIDFYFQFHFESINCKHTPWKCVQRHKLTQETYELTSRHINV